MKIILNIKNEPKAGDVLIFNGRQWEATSKEKLFLESDEKIRFLEDSIAQFKVDVNTKLKDFHEVLQLLSKKE